MRLVVDPFVGLLLGSQSPAWAVHTNRDRPLPGGDLDTLPHWGRAYEIRLLDVVVYFVGMKSCPGMPLRAAQLVGNPPHAQALERVAAPEGLRLLNPQRCMQALRPVPQQA